MWRLLRNGYSCSVLPISSSESLVRISFLRGSCRITDVSYVYRICLRGSNRRPQFEEKKKFNARRHSCLCLEVSVVCPAVSARCIYIKSTDLISRYTRKIKGCVPVSHNDTTVARDTPRLARGNRALVRPNYRGFITPWKISRKRGSR